jgi:hypothetical protein
MRTQRDYQRATVHDLMQDFLHAGDSAYRQVPGECEPWAEFVEAFRRWSTRQFTRAEIKKALPENVVVGRYSRNCFYIANVGRGILEPQWFRLDDDGYLVLAGKAFKTRERKVNAPRVHPRLNDFLALCGREGTTDLIAFRKAVAKFLGLKEIWTTKYTYKQLKLAGFATLDKRIIGLTLEDNACPSNNSSTKNVPVSESPSSAI